MFIRIALVLIALTVSVPAVAGTTWYGISKENSVNLFGFWKQPVILLPKLMCVRTGDVLELTAHSPHEILGGSESNGTMFYGLSYYTADSGAKEDLKCYGRYVQEHDGMDHGLATRSRPYQKECAHLITPGTAPGKGASYGVQIHISSEVGTYLYVRGFSYSDVDGSATLRLMNVDHPYFKAHPEAVTCTESDKRILR